MNPAHTPRSALYRNPWLVTGLVLAVLVLSLLITLPYAIGYGIKSWMLGNGAARIELEDVDFNPFRGALTVRGLQVSSDGETRLHIPEFDLRVDWAPLWRRQLRIRVLELKGARVSVEGSAAEPLRVGGIHLPAGAPPATATQPSWGFGIAQLRITNSVVVYGGPRMQTTARLDQLLVSELATWKPDHPAALSLKGAIDEADLRIKGRLTPFSDNPEFSGNIRLTDLSLHTFTGLLSPRLNRLQGRLSVDTRIQVHRDRSQRIRLDQEGKLALVDLELSAAAGDFRYQQLEWNGASHTDIAPGDATIVLKTKGRLQHGPASLNLTAADVQSRDQRLSWQGTIDLSQTPASTRLAFKGELEHSKLDLGLTGAGLRVQNDGMHWSGELEVEDDATATRITESGNLTFLAPAITSAKDKKNLSAAAVELRGTHLHLRADKQNGTFTLVHRGDVAIDRLAAQQQDDRLSEAHIQWQGELRVARPGDGMRVDTEGRLASKGLRMELPARDLDLRQESLQWSGQAGYHPGGEAPGPSARGSLEIGALYLDEPRHQLGVLAFDRLAVRDIEVRGAKNLDIPELTLENLRIARRQAMTKGAKTASPALLKTTRSVFDDIRFSVPDGLYIRRIAHQGLESIIRVDQQGKLNMVAIIDILTETLAGDTGAPQAKHAPANASTPPGEAPAHGLPVRVDEAMLSGDAVVRFVDEHVSPPYRARITLTKLQIAHIDSARPKQDSPFELQGRIGKYGEVSLHGTARFFDPRGTTDISGRIEALALPPLSPYTARTLGYNLTSGQLDADVDVHIKHGELSGTSRLVIHELEVARLDGKQLKKYHLASPLPLDTGLAMLRDSEDNIRLELPVGGDLSKPSFDPADAINHAIAKGMQQGARTYLAAALFPFGTAIVMAEMAGKAAMEIHLDPVLFAPASSTLDSTSREYLDKVAKVLKERPHMDIKVCGVAVADDRKALVELAAARRQAKAKAAHKAAAKRRAGEERKPGEKQSSGQRKSPVTPPPSVSDEQLEALGSARADAVKDQLIGRGIKARRLIACRARIDTTDQASKPRADLLL